MFGALLGAIPSLIGLIMQGQAQQDQNYLNEQNLQFQKENAKKQYGLATAEHVGALGDVSGYDEALHQFFTHLTPEQRAIAEASQREQKYSLTEGTRRAHELAARQEARSKEAGPIYENLLRDYQYNPPKSEGAYTDEAVTDALLANQDRARGAGSQLATLAVRSGQSPGVLQGIMKAVGDQMAEGSGDALIKGKALGRQVSAGEQQLHQGKLKDLDFFASLADKINPASVYMSDPSGAASKAQSEMENAISGALANQSNQVGNAFGSLAASAGKYPDFSGIANILAGIKDPTGGSNIFAPAATSTTGSGGIFDDPYSLGNRLGYNYSNDDITKMYQGKHG